ncbi:serine protease 7 [Drosophila busckii]|uniref:serine protease 7 n=1 Tax=Drosophila busckii TaxID=30019 RepID=UPI0014329CB7|nr:serine protease 7 [Drosophila busckii]
MKLFVLFLCIIFGETTKARYARCVNPNQRAGLCVQINECQTLYSVLQQSSLSPSERQFIRASGCGRGPDQRPFVCCTQDTGYTRSRRLTSNFADYYDNLGTTPAQRAFVFPSENLGDGFGFGGNGGRVDNSLSQPVAAPGDGSSLLPQPPTCGGVTIENKIYGGDDANLYEFPWTVLLEYRRLAGSGLSTSCAGTLINQRYVLTAAHCLVGRILREIGPLSSVRLGEHDTRSSVDCPSGGGSCAPAAQRLGIAEARAHELYKESSPNQQHDIGLIRLLSNIRYSNSIQPICLPSVVAPESRQVGQQFMVVGWGRTLQTARSPIKQKLAVSFVAPEQCRRKFAERKISIVPTQLCAGGKYAQDSCDGDSGGPLMRFRDNAWVLEGVVSFGYKCGLKDWPGVYTSVAAYDIWIRQQIRP